jgi:multiple antibiotic resistance protein
VGAAIVAFTIWVCYRSASPLSRALGETAMNVFLRLSAFIVLCVGVAILWSGVVGLVQSTPW